jgi:hypothetical protein
MFMPSVYGPLFINDGHLRPVAKTAWRQRCNDDGPDWERTLVLVRELFQPKSPNKRRASGRRVAETNSRRGKEIIVQERKWRKTQIQNCRMTALPSFRNLRVSMRLKIYCK